MNQPAQRQTTEVNVKSVGPSIRFPECDSPATETNSDSPTGEPGRRRAEQVFLTPRVIDGGSFDELASELRGLVVQSSTLLETLGTQTKEARSLADDLNRAAAKHEERLNLGARLLRTVQEQINHLEERANEVERRLDHLQNYESHAEERLNDFQRRLDMIHVEAEQQLARKESELGTRLDEIQQGLETRADRLQTETVALEDRLSNIHQEVDGLARPVSDHLESLIEEARRLVGGESTHGDGEPADPTPGTLSHLLASTREIQEKADFATHQATVIREQCEEVCQALGDKLMRSSETLDQITRRHDNLRLAVNDAAGLCETMETQLSERIARLEEEINRTLAKYDQEVSSRTTALKEAHTGADASLRRISSAQEELEELVQLQAESSERVRALLSRLAPWESILDSTDDDDLPAPLRDLLEKVQAEVSREFAQLGRTLATMAQHAERLARDPAHSDSELADRSTIPKKDSLRIGSITADSDRTRSAPSKGPSKSAASPPSGPGNDATPKDASPEAIETIVTTLATRAAMKQSPSTND